MATPPDFSPGQVLTAAHMDAVGLWLVKTQTVGSGVSSVTVTDAFSSTYENYLITYNGGVMSTGSNIAATIGGSATGYYGVMMYGLYTGGAASNAAQNNATFLGWAGGGDTASASIYLHIRDPFNSTPTEFWAPIRYGTVYGTNVAYHSVAASYTSITFSAASGTMTGGTIRVYGYRK